MRSKDKEVSCGQGGQRRCSSVMRGGLGEVENVERKGGGGVWSNIVHNSAAYTSVLQRLDEHPKISLRDMRNAPQRENWCSKAAAGRV